MISKVIQIVNQRKETMPDFAIGTAAPKAGTMRATTRDGAPAPTWRKLAGVSATGPIYIGQRHYVVVPLPSAFALLQELARRAEDERSEVQSSLAGRVAGQAAYRAWASLAVEISAQVLFASPKGRVAFLRQTLAYVRRSRTIDGLETVLATSVNAAWPWLGLAATDRVLEFAVAALRGSEFASKHAIPVIDPSRRTASLFAPRQLPGLDLAEWRADRSLFGDGSISGVPGLGPTGLSIGKSDVSNLVDRLFGAVGSDAAEDLLHGNDAAGVPGGLPSVGDLPGGKPKGSGGPTSSLDSTAAELNPKGSLPGVPGGLPSPADLPGQKGGNQPSRYEVSTDKRQNAEDDLLSSTPGFEYGGVLGFIRRHGSSGFRTGIFEGATPGGPFAPPGQLGPNSEGNLDTKEGVRDIATGVLGAAGIVVGVAAATTVGPAILVGATAGAMAAGFLIGLGIVEVHEGDRPEPPKDKPRPGDLYPDPDGFGGGGPTRLPDNDGSGVGLTQLPDSDGSGGGTPNTIWGTANQGASIWDDNFGGSGPTVRPSNFVAVAAFGPGLLADVVQIGRSTICF